MHTPLSVGILGTGWVGASVAISILHSGFASELLLSDVKFDVAEGEAMDLAHGASFYPTAGVRSAPFEELLDTSALVISAGRGGKPNETRLDLLRDNARVVGDIGEKLRGYRGLVVVVTNPVDVLTWVVTQRSGLPPERVIGTGTMLDTARLRQVIAAEVEVAPQSVHAQVLGEHGDSEVVLWSGADIGGTRLRDWPGWSEEREGAVAEEVRRAAYRIVEKKGATNHAIGLVTAALLRWMLRGDRRVLTVSRVQEGAMGLTDVALSLPTVVGANGATEVVVPAMSDEEREGVERSAALLRRAIAEAAA